MAFQFRRRYALFTYAQCGGLDHWAVLDHFSNLRAECIIGRENHADGGIHLHAFVDFNRQFSTRDPRFADVEGFHPNVEPCARTPEKMWDYATKDGDVVAGGLERPDGSRVHGTSDPWAQIILAQSRDEFFELCTQLAPRALACSFNSLRAYADWKYRPEQVEYSTPTGLRIDTGDVPGLREWVRENLEGYSVGGEYKFHIGSAGEGWWGTTPPCFLRSATGRDGSRPPLLHILLTIIVRKKSLILIGESRLGKTVWARSLGKHAYFGGLFSLDENVGDVKYAVFDDIQGGLEFFHAYKFWLGHQAEFWATDKYRTKQKITWGKPAIWCSNTDPRMDKGADADWLDANCDFIFLDKKIVF